MSSNTEQRTITLAEMAPHVHSFAPNENKVNKISLWLIKWIEKALAENSIKPNDKLPSKGALAFHIGVSLGTIQNVFRYVEDCGYIVSKQKIGTCIANSEKKEHFEKLISKREIAKEEIKKYIINNNLEPGAILISTRKLAEKLGYSNATIRTAIETLISEGILEKNNNAFLVKQVEFVIENIKNKTLAEKIADNIKIYIKKQYNNGVKLPSNIELAKIFHVSVKTVHDAIKILSKEGLLYTRRGQYGTIIAQDKEESYLYSYEKIELQLRNYIFNNCKIGSKLPPIQDFAREYQVSTKTIKKALDDLAEDGYIAFVRGRYGGTFVTDIPQNTQEAYKWLAISSDFVSNT